LRNGEEATLSVFGSRAVDLAAKKLVADFGVAINVEDPVYVYRGDIQDVTSSRGAGAGKRTLIPKAALLEVRFDLRPDGSRRDVRQFLEDLVETATAQLPFPYRIERDGDIFTWAPTQTRDDQGRSNDLPPYLTATSAFPSERDDSSSTSIC